MPQQFKSHNISDEYVRPYTQEYCRLQSELLRDNGNDPVSAWRIFKIMAEFVQGFELLQNIGKAASVFGSARTQPNAPIYEEGVKLGRLLAEHEYTVITGGGGGIMEALNKGAFEAGGRSVGLNIRLPQEQSLNPYINEAATFHYFFTRKVSLAFSSEVYIYFPGGFGTLDEFFEILTLVQTKKIQSLPIILVGRSYWTPLIEWMRASLLTEHHTIVAEDLDLFHVVDTAEEALAVANALVPEVDRTLKP